jgi:hypothetical protein
MPDDERQPKSFEEAARELADEFKRSIEHCSEADPESIARAAGVDPDRVRGRVDATGAWLRSQFDAPGRKRDPRHEPAAGEDIFRDAEPHPLDVPTPEQGIALAALDSGRWALAPGTATLSVCGGGPATTDQN